MPLRTPTSDRELLAEPHFADIPALIDHNRKLLDSSKIVIDGIALRELRALARQELLAGDRSAPQILTGHQPELFHPGVWVKNFAANGLARRLGGTAANLIVDSDLLKGISIALPAWQQWRPESVRIENIPFAGGSRDQTWETAVPIDDFPAIPDRISEVARLWNFEPIALQAWPAMTGTTVGDRFVSARTHFEQSWGCANREIKTSCLSRSAAFRHFANHLCADHDRFRSVHNAAVREYRQTRRLRSRTHPVPELAEGEVPFWHADAIGRSRVTLPLVPERIRPRALTLTLFARLCLGDLFIHGIGGGKYDSVTDSILRGYFRIEPPPFQVVSATLRLPLPRFPSTAEDVRRLHRLTRDLHWNPQHFLPEGQPDHERIRIQGTVPGSKQQYRAFRALGERLRPNLTVKIDETRRALVQARTEVEANAILERRDFAWVLYPKHLLRTYFQEVRERATS